MLVSSGAVWRRGSISGELKISEGTGPSMTVIRCDFECGCIRIAEGFVAHQEDGQQGDWLWRGGCMERMGNPTPSVRERLTRTFALPKTAFKKPDSGRVRPHKKLGGSLAQPT